MTLASLVKNVTTEVVEYIAKNANALANGNGVTDAKERNAIAHAHTSAWINYRLNYDIATFFGDVKELADPSNYPEPTLDSIKDQFNNEVGRSIALYVKTLELSDEDAKDAIDDLIMKALDDGDLITDETIDVRAYTQEEPTWSFPTDFDWQGYSAGRDYTGTDDLETVDIKINRLIGAEIDNWLENVLSYFNGSTDVSSVTVTQPDAKTFVVTKATSPTAAMALDPQSSGVSYIYDLTTNIAINVSGTSLVGHETATVIDAYGKLVFGERSDEDTGILQLADGTKITGLASTANAKLLNESSRCYVLRGRDMACFSCVCPTSETHLHEIAYKVLN